MRTEINTYLMAGDSAPRLPKSQFPLAVEGRPTPRRIALLAEDNLADVLLIQEAIELHAVPIDLHVVEDGEKALEFIERAENDPDFPCPDVLLLDLNLPKRSGKEVLQRVRQSEKCKDILVLIITSSDLSKDREDLAGLGANHYFRKPTSYEQFLKVGEVLKALLETGKPIKH